MIILNSGGVTYKHPEPAKVGDLWISIYGDIKDIVAITWTDGSYITFQPMNNDWEEMDTHSSQFYSRFEKLNKSI